MHYSSVSNAFFFNELYFANSSSKTPRLVATTLFHNVTVLPNYNQLVTLKKRTRTFI